MGFPKPENSEITATTGKSVDQQTGTTLTIFMEKKNESVSGTKFFM